MKCRLRGTTPCCSARTAFISPSAPAADWVCPKLVFTDASAHGPSRPYTSARLAYSMGSPTGVPGPCASTMPTVRASTSATANAARYASTCAGRDGVTIFTVWPSWLAAVPRITARIRSPSASASGNRLSNSTTQPSPATNPSAAMSNAWQRPVADSIPMAEPEQDLRGSNDTEAPPARAMSLSPSCRLRQATCTAARPDEQAVSTVIAGPRSPMV